MPPASAAAQAPTLSIVCPMFDEADTLAAFEARLMPVLAELTIGIDHARGQAVTPVDVRCLDWQQSLVLVTRLFSAEAAVQGPWQ